MFSTVGDVSRPPVGSGSYAAWAVFVIVIMLSVAAGGFLLAAVGIKRG